MLPLLAAILTLLAAAALVGWRLAPPPVRGGDAPASEFSAERARAVLERLLGPGDPHPTGTAANAAVRDRVVAELQALGLEPEVDSRVVCGGWGRCATVDNVLARIAGSDPALDALLLVVHYDSVAAGPGAADDGAGVAAVVEVARALLAGPPLPRDLLLLVDDGEEQGLLGAESFVQHSPWAERVAAVVNLEARGTSGPSVLFEMSPGNAALVAAAAEALERPSTNSIYYTVYQRLPNDTDLTVFKRAGLPGVNFGFIGDPLRYHTPRDDLAHLDLRSLQHHGDNALAMVRSLAAAEARFVADGDAVFFDLLGWGVVRWPAEWSLPLALAALLLVAATAVFGGRRAAGPARWGWAFAVAAGLLVATGAAGWALAALLRAAGATPYAWVARPGPLLLAFWALPVAVAGGLAALAGERLTPRGAWGTAWLLAAALGCALALSAPGAGYPFVGPALVAGALGVATAGRAPLWAGLPATGLQAILVFPFAWKLFEALGAGALPGLAALVALVLLGGLLPGLAAAGRRARLAVAGAAGLVLAGAAVAAAFGEPFSPSSPRPLSLVLHHAAGEGARWLAGAGEGPLPAPLAQAAGFASEPVRAYPWSAGRAFAAAAAVAAPPAPELAGLTVERRGGDLVVSARLVSPRGAPSAGVYVAATRLADAKLDGLAVRYPPRVAAVREDPEAWLGVEHLTLPAAGVPIEIVVVGAAPVELYVWDASPGLGPEGDALLRARPEWAVPIGRGDRTLVSQRVLVEPPG